MVNPKFSEESVFVDIYSFLHVQMLFQKAVENEQVENIINSMPSNKAPRVDKITIRAIKDCLSAILPTIRIIINNTFVSETFPSTWKIAKATPIPKDGDAEQARNSRHFAFTSAKVWKKSP